ncbi:lipoprotein LpqH [Mycobacteroides abscessus]|uniref:lipoprotein LpqH n=1 Tax=Mycobacteroides abscessus TaxID=36809 RepID=UPI0026708014|nr:lipoprotein LpqH [Mycobacteroides abscessus]MDO3110455.1 lipoprotein LpqH [Mycobacteroides abscessus subsp. abscessus]
MKHGWVVAAAVAAVLTTGLTGCSKDEKASGSSAVTAGSSTVADAGKSGASSTKVRINGKARDVQNHVDCSADASQRVLEEGRVMAIEIGDRSHGLRVHLTKTDPPVVRMVQSMGDFDGTTLAYPDQFGRFSLGEPQATKDGNTYKISGTASGYEFNASVDEAPTTIPFEVEMTCP